MRKNFGFTLIEIIIVLGIISILMMLGLVSYPNLQKKARDASRVAEVDNIRSALELYRTNNSYYPESLSDLTENSLYLQTIPTDPLSPKHSYTYVPKTGCDNETVLCNDYTIGLALENDPEIPCTLTLTCGTLSCNFCLGPYGEK
ncbi:MAG: prepilin-type N-terminal cleavage/methylation domain-containing protein [Patescibacteria group bacterium]